MSSIEPLSSDFGSRPVTELGPGLGQVGIGSRPGTKLQLGPGLGTGWIRCQVWDLTWWGPDLGTGCSKRQVWNQIAVGSEQGPNCSQVQAWTLVHSGPSMGPRHNHILRHSLWNWSISRLFLFCLGNLQHHPFFLSQIIFSFLLL